MRHTGLNLSALRWGCSLEAAAALIVWVRHRWLRVFFVLYAALVVAAVVAQNWPHSDPWANTDGSIEFGTALCQPRETSPCITGESSSFRRGALKRFVAHLHTDFNPGFGFTIVVVRHVGGNQRTVSTQPLSLLTLNEVRDAKEGLYTTFAPTFVCRYDSRSLTPGNYTMSIRLRRATLARGDFRITA